MLPAPNPMVLVAPPDGQFIVTLPLTDNELVESVKLRTPALAAVVLPIVTEAHAALYPLGIVTVRATAPSAIKTSSPATGTDAPAEPPEVADQVEVKFQFALATAYLDAALATEAPASKATSVRSRIAEVSRTVRPQLPPVSGHRQSSQ